MEKGIKKAYCYPTKDIHSKQERIAWISYFYILNLNTQIKEWK